MRFRLPVVSVVLCSLLLLPGWSWGDVVLTIKESAINKLGDRIGPLSDSGSHHVDAPYPCFVWTERAWGICGWGFFKTCYVRVYSATWQWTVSNVRFSIAPTGISST